MFVIGEKPEMANVVKVSGNFLIAAVIESLAEAIALARKYGIDPHDYVDFLTNSLFAAPVYKTYGGLIADAKHETAGFALRLGLKDIRLALSAAESSRRFPATCASLDTRPYVDGDRPRLRQAGLERAGEIGGGKCGVAVSDAADAARLRLQACPAGQIHPTAARLAGCISAGAINTAGSAVTCYNTFATFKRLPHPIVL